MKAYRNSSRNVENFNFGWKFNKGDVSDGCNPELVDHTWQEIDLPHDWSVEGPFNSKWASSTGYLPTGIGWYRKTFTLPKINQDRRIFIYFEGVYNNSEVWVNGRSVGKRPNGYVSFYYDISQYVHLGQENIIAVRVDHTKFADSRWYTGSGIYRNVQLITTNSRYIKPWGVYARPILQDSNHGRLEINVLLMNETSVTSTLIVSNELKLEGNVIEKTETRVEIPAKEESIVFGTMKIENPLIWDIENPVLYELISTVQEGEVILDHLKTWVGFRSIRFDATKGFFLNNRNLKMKGVCIHHEAGCLGAAVPKDVLKRRLKVLKEVGCNAIRTSHNAFSPDFYNLCDQMGFLVIDEVFDEWELLKNKWIKGWNQGTPGKEGYAEYFKQWAEIDLRDQVLRDRNHPSIIMWSIGNEIDYPNDPYSHKIQDTEKKSSNIREI